MNHKRLLNALAKVGATVTNPHADNTKAPRYFKATGKNGEVVCWYVQKKWDNPEELEATSVHTPSPHTDIMTDCFCDTYYHTIKGAVGALT
jgi:uncharacterized Zn finger protein (UPF0148 family)